MKTGTYRIPLACGETPEQNRRVQQLLKSLDRGSAVAMTVHMEPLILGEYMTAWTGRRCEVDSGSGRYQAGSYVEVNASGGTPRKHLQRTPRVTVLPVPADTCRKRAEVAERFLPENKQQSVFRHGERWDARKQELSAMTEDLVRAEVEYWRELETISGQREHFKPGRTDESSADDGIAA